MAKEKRKIPKEIENRFRMLKFLKNDSAFILYGLLKYVSDDNGETTITNPEIEGVLGWEYGKVVRAVKELEDKVLISRSYENKCQNDCKRTIKIHSKTTPIKSDTPTINDTPTPIKSDAPSELSNLKSNSIINKEVEDNKLKEKDNSINSNNSNGSMLKSDTPTINDTPTEQFTYWDSINKTILSGERRKRIEELSLEEVTQLKEDGDNDAEIFFTFKKILPIS